MIFSDHFETAPFFLPRDQILTRFFLHSSDLLFLFHSFLNTIALSQSEGCSKLMTATAFLNDAVLCMQRACSLPIL